MSFEDVVKRAQWYQLVGESFCFLGSSSFIVDYCVAGPVANYSTYYLLGCIGVAVGSTAMIVQSIKTICSKSFARKEAEECIEEL